MRRLFVKKPVARILEESARDGLKRSLGPWNLVSLGIGCIIGTGIFVLTGSAAANHAGPALMLSFILTGIACGFVGLCYAELASVLPVSGSAYTYAYATLGEIFAWVMGCLLALEYGVAAATVAAGWSGYVNSFLLTIGVMIPPELTAATGELVKVSETFRSLFVQHGYAFDEAGKLLASDGSPVTGVFNLPASIGALLASSLLVIGVSESAKVNNFIVFIKVAVVVMFIAVGAFYIDPANWTPFIPENQGPGKFGWDGVLSASSVIFFAYIGFEAVSTAGQEARNPQKDMSFGILGSLLICTILYILVSGVLTGVVPYTQLNVPDPMAVAADKMGLGWFSFFVKIGAITGLSSVMLVLIYGQTRIFYMMSKDGLIPPVFHKVHPKFQTPHLNTVIVGGLVALSAGLAPISLLSDLVNLGTLTAFAIVCIGVLYLRKAEPGLHRPFKTPFVPVVPILGTLACGFLAFGIFFSFQEGGIALKESGVTVFKYVGSYLAAGCLLYAFYGVRHSKLSLEKRG